jgi:outer membrane protein TolC
MEEKAKQMKARRINSIILLVTLLGCFSFSYAQGDTIPEQDSSVILMDSIMTYEAFIERVKKHHPVVFRAQMKAQMGERGVQGAKGGFDPVLGGDAKQKYFDDKKYYSHINGYLKVPTWFGITAEAGYQETDGIFLNPEARLPENGLWYAGLNLELGNGLIIDQRRAELKKARLFEQATDLERRVMTNQLVNDATISYWKWAKAYEILQVYRQALEAAELRLEAIKTFAEFGDQPGIYVTEAAMQYQSRLMSFQQATLDWQNASLKLEVFLWDQGVVPLELNGAVPNSLSSEIEPMRVLMDMDTVIAGHPLVELNDLEIARQRIDLRLKREYLKPKLTLEYRALNEPVTQGFFSEYTIADYTWGAKVSYPLFTRRERADVRIGDLKVQSQELKGAEITAKLEYQLAAARNTIENLLAQYEVIEETIDAAALLLDAEEELFDNGESSLFMINSRELKYLEVRVKQVELASKVEISKSELNYGLLLILP